MSDEVPTVNSGESFALRVWRGVEGVFLQWVLYALLLVLLFAIAYYVSSSVSSTRDTIPSGTDTALDESRAGILRSISDLSRSEIRPEEERLQILEDLSETGSPSALSEQEKLELLSNLKKI